MTSEPPTSQSPSAGASANARTSGRAGDPASKAAAGPRAFAPADDALFDPVVDHSGDARTVGDLLVDADLLARQLLLDLSGRDAAGLLRGWPAVVEIADRMWEALPGQHPAVLGDIRHMTRLAALTGSMGKTMATASWPGPGPVDRRVDEVARTLAAATELVELYGAEVNIEHGAVYRDAAAARTRVMHCVYVTAHAVGIALHEHGLELASRTAATGRDYVSERHPEPFPGYRWLQRIRTCELTAGHYVRHGRFARGIAGATVQPVENLHRLSQALVSFDIQTHRTLTAAATPANMVLACRTQGMIAGASMAIARAADHGGLLPSPGAERLAAAADRAGHAWSHLGSRWSDLTTAGDRIDPKLMAAAAAVRDACREVTHDRAGLASTAVIAGRPALHEAVPAVLQALEAGPDTAHVVSATAHQPGLRGPARPLSIRASNDAEAHQSRSATGPARRRPSDGQPADAAWVTAADILADRTVPLPAPAAVELRAAATRLLDCASNASAVAAVIHSDREAYAQQPRSRPPRDDEMTVGIVLNRPRGRAGSVPRPPGEAPMQARATTWERTNLATRPVK